MDDKMKKILEYYYNDPETKELIADLKTVIDEIEYPYTKFNTIIKELARRLYEDNICEKDKISQIIKYLLLDKIKKYKISARWIEECLPRDYKRKYTIKSEVSSLTSKIPKTITITNNTSEVLDSNINSTFQWDKDFNSQNKNRLSYERKEENDEIKELKEIIDKYEKFISADQIFTENTEFIISGEKFQILKDEIEKSKKKCYLKFNTNKVAREIYSDT